MEQNYWLRLIGFYSNASVPGLYGFMIHILDDQNTVLTAIQGGTLDKSSCGDRITEIGRILREGNRITIAASGDLNQSKKMGKKAYSFPHRGDFFSNGQVLQYLTVMNEHGRCYDAYSGSEPPCPRESLPTTKEKQNNELLKNK